ncbi:hypothetical protein F5X68DRAFT_217772 [Plectosphaerella plurivora]|uniref:Uncharacterized protein n=1 Tax=Plectosphaerella plurivora TaxID=936078 RepID=A0A9P9A6B3_9PEZI|nr:hypothetical protein F5X68DRAFT_217772 [Plectosphaerella plurivora]
MNWLRIDLSFTALSAQALSTNYQGLIYGDQAVVARNQGNNATNRSTSRCCLLTFCSWATVGYLAAWTARHPSPSRYRPSRGLARLVEYLPGDSVDP